MKVKKIALLLFFIANACYLFFFRIMENKDMSLLFRPMIIPFIFLYYTLDSKEKKNPLHLLLLGLIFVADNINLLLETIFYQFAILIYLIVLVILFFLIVKDAKIINKDSKLYKYLGLLFIVAIAFALITKITSVFIVKTKFHSYYLILNYIVFFVGVLTMSCYNFIKFKSSSAKFLLLGLGFMFLSDLLSVTKAYYLDFEAFVYVIMLFELPVYYFFAQFFIERDKNAAKIKE